MKLWFFGDSFTYGHGLSDCAIYNAALDFYDAGLTPSKLGWANIVSQTLGLEHINMSLPGMSNLKIHWKIRNAKFEPDDIVIAQWSFPTRCAILDDDMTDIYVWPKTEISENFYRVHTPLDLERRSLIIVEHTELLMKSLGVKYVAFANRAFDANMHAYSEISDYQSNFVVDTAIDDGHPGVESNRRWATQVTQILKYKFGI